MAVISGAPCSKHQGSFLTGETESRDASLLAFGSLDNAGESMFLAAFLALRRAGAPMTYPTMPMGSNPYKIKVKKAPNAVPTGLVASAMAIIKATYSHAMSTKYI